MLALLALTVLAQPQQQLVPQIRTADGGIAIRVWMDTNSISVSGGGGGGPTPTKVEGAYHADASYFAYQLISNPTDCAAGGYATAIDALGNLTCSPIPKVGESYSADASITAQSLASNPTDCGGGTYATAIDQYGNLTCASPPAGNFIETTIVLSGGSGYFSTPVTGQAWVTATSKIICAIFGNTDAGLTPEVIAIGELNAVVSSLVVGDGFLINVFSPNGLEGTVQIHCNGV